MIDMILRKTNLKSLNERMDYSGLKQKVTAHNIANINTPGYSAKEVRFKDVLDRTVSRLNITDPKHISPGSPDKYEVKDIKDKSIKNGINNVDIDHEMVELAKNQMDFNFSATMTARLFRKLKGVINGKLE